MEINAANVAWHKSFLWGAEFPRQKLDKRKTNSESCLKKKYKKFRKKKSHRVRNENIQWYVPVKFPESCKISNVSTSDNAILAF